MNIRKSEKGVTLIALAVTIIVMLILAGATIATLTGEDGIIAQATKSRDKSDIAKVEEVGKLEYSNLIMEKQMDAVGEEVTIGDVKKKMEEQGYEIASKDGKSYAKIGPYYYEMKLENGEFSIAKEKAEVTITTISKTDSYVGYYADLDGDGTPEGIIFADLLKEIQKEKVHGEM